MWKECPRCNGNWSGDSCSCGMEIGWYRNNDRDDIPNEITIVLGKYCLYWFGEGDVAGECVINEAGVPYYKSNAVVVKNVPFDITEERLNKLLLFL